MEDAETQEPEAAEEAEETVQQEPMTEERFEGLKADAKARFEEVFGLMNEVVDKLKDEGCPAEVAWMALSEQLHDAVAGGELPSYALPPYIGRPPLAPSPVFPQGTPGFGFVPTLGFEPPHAYEEFSHTEAHGLEGLEQPAEELGPDWEPSSQETFSMDDAKTGYGAKIQLSAAEAKVRAAQKREAKALQERHRKVSLFRDVVQGGLQWLSDKLNEPAPITPHSGVPRVPLATKLFTGEKPFGHAPPGFDHPGWVEVMLSGAADAGGRINPEPLSDNCCQGSGPCCHKEE
jgi:hypothetical protein